MTETVPISRRAADRLHTGSLWVYRSDLTDEASLAALSPGALVTVTDPAGRPLGSALYSSASEIALRLVSREAGLDRAGYLAALRQRVGAALDRRRRIAPLSEGPGAETNAQRLLFSEADEVPGIVVDRYHDLVVLQLLTQGTAQDDVRALLAEALPAALAGNLAVEAAPEPFGGAAGEPLPEAATLTLWERPDPRIRELEELAPPPEGPLLAPAGATPPRTYTTFLLNGLRFGYDTNAGQKTGAFLDQRLNYAAAANAVRRSGRTGHALDVCTYHGGFALHLAQVCQRVTGVDQSRAALEQAERNLELNGDRQLRAAVDWMEADAFALLRALADAQRGSTVARDMGLPARFDAVVLDPPAFTKSRRALEGALRGYKELNLRALQLITSGGTLVTCSCSHHVSLQVFWETVAAAAADAGRRVQILETRAAAPDHPEIATLPETRYLKCLICRVE